MKLFRLFALVLALGAEVKNALEDRHISPEEARGIGEKLISLFAELAGDIDPSARAALAKALNETAADLLSSRL